MPIFQKNPNESAYYGGKKHFIDVLKNTGSPDMLIWRQPEEDFNTGATLIVMPGETALFVKGGKIEGVLGEGTYKLTTENYPFLSRIINSLSAGISAYNCVVYFVRMIETPEIAWGTDRAIQVRDKVWNIRTDVQARSVYKLKVCDPARFLRYLIGNRVNFATAGDIIKHFKYEFEGKIKSVVSEYLNALDRELIGIESLMDVISQELRGRVDSLVAEYGLTCTAFSLFGLDVDKSKYEEFDRSQIDLYKKRQEVLGKSAEFEILGDERWQKMRNAELLEKSIEASSGGGSAVGEIGAGLGLGLATAGAVNSFARQAFSSVTNQVFEPAANSAPKSEAPASVDPLEQLSKLKKMLDMGLIEKEEYDSKKSEILARM